MNTEDETTHFDNWLDNGLMPVCGLEGVVDPNGPPHFATNTPALTTCSGCVWWLAGRDLVEHDEPVMLLDHKEERCCAAQREGVLR